MPSVSWPAFPGLRRVPLPAAATPSEASLPKRQGLLPAIRSIRLPLLSCTCVLGLQICQEAVHYPPCTCVVVEGLAHDAAGKGGGQGAYLRAQRHNGRLALGFDLCVARRGDAGRLCCCLLL